jgi:hypothetical protein
MDDINNLNLKLIDTAEALSSLVEKYHNNSNRFVVENYRINYSIALVNIELIHMKNCIVDADVEISISGSDTKINFELVTFNGKFVLSGSGKIRDLIIHKCTFYKSIYLSSLSHEKSVIIQNTTLLDGFVAVDIRLQENLVFGNCSVVGTISFQNSRINGYLKLIVTSITKGLMLEGLTSDTDIYLSRSNIFNFKAVNVPSIFNKGNPGNYSFTNDQKRALFQRLKNIYLSENNYIDAAAMKQIEMAAHYELLKDEIFRFGKFKKYIVDFVILFTSKWSNNFGSSWLHGVLFTLGLAVSAR